MDSGMQGGVGGDTAVSDRAVRGHLGAGEGISCVDTREDGAREQDQLEPRNRCRGVGVHFLRILRI